MKTKKGTWKRRLLWTGGIFVLLVILLIGYVFFPWSISPRLSSFELVAHRGVHQTFPLDNLKSDTCTAQLVYPPKHEFIENTIPSMREAFARGADVVELDIHPTKDNYLVVFHDYGVDCRTNGKGITEELTFSYLKSLDIGYGYTPDGGKTYPLRGKGVGMMPTLKDVLKTFPDKKFVIHQKDLLQKTVDLLIKELQQIPASQQKLLYYWGNLDDYKTLQAKIPGLQKYFFTQRDVKTCQYDYLGMLITGSVPEKCKDSIIAASLKQLKSIPGWPNLILAKAHQAGIKVFVNEIDTEEDWEQVRDLPIDGIMTNYIETIGPLVKRR